MGRLVSTEPTLEIHPGYFVFILGGGGLCFSNLGTMIWELEQWNWWAKLELAVTPTIV